MNQLNKKPVVFFDRDGTLNEEIGYIRDIDKLVLIDGAAESVKKLNGLNVAVILVTNQSGAARGYYSEGHIVQLNERLVRLLDAKGARLDALYYCPHLPEGSDARLAVACQCRKPESGLADKAYEDLPELDRAKSYVVGDKATDVELAKNIGAKGVLVKTGYGQDVLDGTYQWQVQPDFVASNIVEAVNWIVSDLNLDAGAMDN